MTAIEWLVQKTKLTDFWKEEIQEALEMEKEQIIDAYIEGHNVCRCVTDNTDEAKECFDEWFKTYKSNNP